MQHAARRLLAPRANAAAAAATIATSTALPAALTSAASRLAAAAATLSAAAAAALTAAAKPSALQAGPGAVRKPQVPPPGRRVVRLVEHRCGLDATRRRRPQRLRHIRLPPCRMELQHRRRRRARTARYARAARRARSRTTYARCGCARARDHARARASTGDGRCPQCRRCKRRRGAHHPRHLGDAGLQPLGSGPALRWLEEELQRGDGEDRVDHTWVAGEAAGSASRFLSTSHLVDQATRPCYRPC